VLFATFHPAFHVTAITVTFPGVPANTKININMSKTHMHNRSIHLDMIQCEAELVAKSLKEQAM